MKIIDNFLAPSYANLIEDLLQSESQEWYFKSNTIGYRYQKNQPPLQYGFSLLMFSEVEGGWTNTNASMILRPFLLQVQETVGAQRLLSARIDMTVANSSRVLHLPHVDMEGVENTTAIYYVSDSDGDTLVYNEKHPCNNYTIQKKITPKKNRLCFFDGDYYHTGHSPMEHPNRILINANFV